MKKLLLTATAILLAWASQAQAQYIRADCATLMLASGDRATCYNYGESKWQYWGGSSWTDVPGAGGGGGGSGTVTSVVIGSGLASTQSPLTTTGTLSIATGGVTAAMLAGSIPYTKLIGTDIVTVGTITTGTWQGTTIAANKGGTGQTTFTTGDVLYASSSSAISKLAIGTSGQCLTVTAGLPSWGACGSIAAGTLNELAIYTSSSAIGSTSLFRLVSGVPNIGVTATQSYKIDLTSAPTGLNTIVAPNSANPVIVAGIANPGSDGNCVKYIGTDGSQNRVTCGSGGGLSGLTTGTILKAASATTASDSSLLDCGSTTVAVGSCASNTGNVEAGKVKYAPTAGSAPTASGEFTYNSTTNRYSVGVNGANKSLAFTDELSGGGITGLTTGTIPKAASSTTIGDSSLLDCGSTTIAVGSCASNTGTIEAGLVSIKTRVQFPVTKTTASANITLTTSSSSVQFVDPNGADRNITAHSSPAAGDYYEVKNIGGANNVLVKNSGGTTLATLAAGYFAKIIYDGAAWQVVNYGN